ncbi:MAG TPA: hypothetical protein PKZ75_14925 [Bacteroidia bacterium]|nr:hypothetical protein [Bacteroidia bacterium]
MKHIVLFLLIPFVAFAQETEKVFFESGVSIFSPFAKNERVISDMEYQGSSDLKYTYKTAPGFFIKCGIEVFPKTQRKFSVTVPISIGYKEFNQKFVKEGYSYGCFSNFNGKEKSQISSKVASIMIGPKFNFDIKSITVFCALNLNADLVFLHKETIVYKTVTSETYNSSKSSQPQINDFKINSSLQLAFDYKISDQWSLGLSADSYFYNLTPIINNDKQNSNLFNIGYGKQSLFICSGIRAGYSF